MASLYSSQWNGSLVAAGESHPLRILFEGWSLPHCKGVMKRLQGGETYKFEGEIDGPKWKFTVTISDATMIEIVADLTGSNFSGSWQLERLKKPAATEATDFPSSANVTEGAFSAQPIFGIIENSLKVVPSCSSSLTIVKPPSDWQWKLVGRFSARTEGSTLVITHLPRFFASKSNDFVYIPVPLVTSDRHSEYEVIISSTGARNSFHVGFGTLQEGGGDPLLPGRYGNSISLSSNGSICYEDGGSSHSFQMFGNLDPDSVLSCRYSAISRKPSFSIGGNEYREADFVLDANPLYFIVVMDSFGSEVRISMKETFDKSDTWHSCMVEVCNKCHFFKFLVCAKHGYPFVTKGSQAEASCSHKSKCTFSKSHYKSCSDCSGGSSQTRVLTLRKIDIRKVLKMASENTEEEKKTLSVSSLICPQCSRVMLWTPNESPVEPQKFLHFSNDCSVEAVPINFTVSTNALTKVGKRMESMAPILQEVPLLLKMPDVPWFVKAKDGKDVYENILSPQNPVVVVMVTLKWCPISLKILQLFYDLKTSSDFKNSELVLMTVDAENISHTDGSISWSLPESQRFPTCHLFYEGKHQDSMPVSYALKALRERVRLLVKLNHIPGYGAYYRRKLNSKDADFVRIMNLFYDNLGGLYAKLRFSIASIEAVSSNKMNLDFREERSRFRKTYGTWELAGTQLVFHGTAAENVPTLTRDGFDKGKMGATDGTEGGKGGFFGSGFYFSAQPDYCFLYNSHGRGIQLARAGDTCTLVVFEVLLGRSLQLEKGHFGAEKQSGYDSHTSPKGFEYILFENKQCRPTHVITVKVSKAIPASEVGTTSHTG